jgi:RHS repeat-associated protein
LRTLYHPDHISTELNTGLGNTSWITDGSGNAIQYMHYLPYGEAWIDQQSTSWNAPYTFTGKIKDAETGYNYFGARYYDSQLSVWLSVDPMSDQYPSMSPYTYCANNPIMMVDPDGRMVTMFGELAELAIQHLNNYSDLGIYIQENGQLARLSDGHSKLDQILTFMIDNPKYEFEMYCSSQPLYNACEGSNSYAIDGSAYLGNEVYLDNENNVTKVKAYQYLDVSALANIDHGKRIEGGSVAHEFVEAFCGALLADINKSGSTISTIFGSNYPKVHAMANTIICGTLAPKNEYIEYLYCSYKTYGEFEIFFWPPKKSERTVEKDQEFYCSPSLKRPIPFDFK